MRIMVIEAEPAEARALQRELAGRYEIRFANSTAAALALLSHQAWRPDVVVTSLAQGDEDAEDSLSSLQAASFGAPVLVRARASAETLRRQLDGLASLQGSDKGAGFSLLKAVLQQQHYFQQTVTTHRGEIMTEIDRVARQSADTAVARALEQLVDRLGLDDEEGLRMAIRLARGWEAAKGRFFSAIAAGIGSAFLLAVGAGIVAMLRIKAAP